MKLEQTQIQLGERLAQLRKENGYSQAELAEKLYITRQAVSNWERSKSQPDLNAMLSLAALYGIDMNTLLGSVTIHPPAPDRTAARILYLISTGVATAYIVYALASGRGLKMSSMIMLLTVLFMGAVVHLAFGYAIKNEDYTLIAGYDSNAEYNMTALRRQLATTELLVMISTLVYALLFVATALAHAPEFVAGILIAVYVADYIFGILFISYRYRDRVHVKPVDKAVAGKSFFAVILFIIIVLLMIVDVALSMTYFNIANNTQPAMQIGFIVILCCCVNAPWLLIESKRMKKCMEGERRYRLSVYTIAAWVVSAVLLALIPYIAYLNRIQ